MQETDVRPEPGSGVGVEIHRGLRRGRDVVDELAIAAAQIEHCMIRADPSAEKTPGEDLPNPVAISCGANKAPVVNFGELLLVVGHGENLQSWLAAAVRSSSEFKTGDSRPCDRCPGESGGSRPATTVPRQFFPFARAHGGPTDSSLS